MDYKFVNFKELKTYKKVINYDSDRSKQDDKKVPLSTQNAIKFLLDGTLRLRVCRYCLSVTSQLSELDEILTLAVSGALHDVTLKDIIASFHPFKVAEDPNFPNKICNECINRAISCYLFSQQCERSERALRNCFDDIHEKFEKLDPLEPVKKRGKRKLNPNYNILYAEHTNVLNYAEPIINIINIDVATHNNNEISEFECPKCWQVLPNTESLLNHEKIHPKTMWYNCRLCGKSFVKRYHLKRHLKREHKDYNEKVIDKKDEHYECKKCGSFSKTLGEHLQHIEKHKFKTMFKCLIERKVDALCSICFDKSNNLADLREIVHLHGGYPGVTGDKCIEDILSTTLPGHEQSKYQELLVPNKATIITLMKRKKYFDKGKSLKQSIEVCLAKKLKYSLSSPILVEEDTVEDFKSVAFIFSKPYQVNPIQTIKCQIVKGVKITEIDECNTLNPEQDTDIKEKQVDLKNKSEIMKTVEGICKICWIFGSTTCQSCLELSKQDYKKVLGVEDNVYYNEKKIEDCKFCWLFKKNKQCSYCKQYFDKEETTSNIKDITFNKNKVETVEAEGMERLKEQETWQCYICLSINPKNRLTCLCCEKTKDNWTKQKNNFGYGETFLFGSKFISYENDDTPIKEVSKRQIQNTGVIIPDLDKPTKVNENLSNESNTDMYQTTDCENANVTLPFKMEEKNGIPVSNLKLMIEESPMDVEVIPYYFNETVGQKINDTNSDHLEDMDVTFEDSIVTLPQLVEYTSNSAQIFEAQNAITSLTFNMGAGDSLNKKNRRIKTPIRRKAMNK